MCPQEQPQQPDAQNPPDFQLQNPPNPQRTLNQQQLQQLQQLITGGLHRGTLARSIRSYGPRPDPPRTHHASPNTHTSTTPHP